MRALNLLLFLLASAAGMAQIAPIAANFNQTQTFGMIGVAFNQTARLNVVNTAMPPPTESPVAPPPCKVTLQIFDDQNTKLQELAVDNLVPGKAVHADYARPVSTSPASPLRVQVRGVVTIPSLPLGTPSPLPVTGLFPFQTCTVVPTLEVFDNDTGRTLVILTNPAIIPKFFISTL